MLPSMGTIYASCNDTVCTCSSSHTCDDSAFPEIILPTQEYAVGDEYLIGTSDAGIKENDPPLRYKKVRSNRNFNNFHQSSVSTLFPADSMNPIMDELAAGGRRVRYLTWVRLFVPPSQSQYFALYKIFIPTENNPLGEDDLETDVYAAVRIAASGGSVPDVPSEFGPAGLINANSSNFFKLKPNSSNFTTEIAIRYRVEHKGSGGGNPRKWFHAVGAFL
ncbi:MAG: hypothetical protein KDA96_19735 [Planctomycetaceae bacterium]|nr:hypothetical protein [Planctomycetaceae bacterium]